MLTVPSHVYVRNVPRGRYGKHIRVLPHGSAILLDEVAVTEPARVAADCARLMSSREALIVADGLLAGKWCTKEDLAEQAARLRNTTGVQRVRWLADNADPGGQSPGESWMRLVVTCLGYDVVTQHHVVCEDRQAWLDLLVRGTLIGLEFDGQSKYITYGPTKVVGEKLRAGELEELGYQLLSVVWQQLDHPERLDKRLRRAGAVPTRSEALPPW
jgi:hypothetical protein